MFTKTIFKNTIGFMLLSTVGAALSDIADALVLGLRLGQEGLAVISFITPIYMLYNVLGIGLATGGAICYAKLLGAGKAEAAVAHFNEVTWAGVAMGIMTAILGVMLLPQLLVVFGVRPEDGQVYEMTRHYANILLLCSPVFFLHSLLLAFVRSDDGAKIASVAFVAGSAVDICLNFVFVFFLDMGVEGAVSATVIGAMVGAAICLWHVFRQDTILQFRLCRPSIRRLFASFGSGLATSTQSAWNMVFFIAINNLLMRLGGAAAVAVFDVTMNVSYLALPAFSASGETLIPMVATFMGERNQKAVGCTLRLALRWGVRLGLTAIAGQWLLARPLCQLFGLTAEISDAYGVFAVRCYLVGAVAGGMSVILMHYYQAVNRERMAFLISSLRGFVLFLPIAVTCGRVFGLHGIWIMFPLTEVLTLVLAMLVSRWNDAHSDMAQEKDQNETWLLDTTEQSLAQTLEQAEAFAERLDASPRQAMVVVMMMEEICTAIMQIGFSGNHGCIQVTLIKVGNDMFELHIRDNAPSFDLFSTKTHRIASADDEDAVKSLPVLLIRKNAKAHYYRRYQGFNTLTVTIGE